MPSAVVYTVKGTPHTITVDLVDEDGTRKGAVYAPSGEAARVRETDKVVCKIGEVPLVKKTYHEIEGLPPARPNTLLIVPAFVGLANKAAGYPRDDLICPDTGPSARRENGVVKSVAAWVVY